MRGRKPNISALPGAIDKPPPPPAWLPKFANEYSPDRKYGGPSIFGEMKASTGPRENFYTAKIQKLRTSMARPRTPTAVLELRGSFINHPSRGRDRKDEPSIASDLPDPSKYLAATAIAAWLEMQSRGYWLTSADRFLVEIAATLMGRYRADMLASGDISMLIGLLGKIGFSPSERGKMNI